MPKRLLAALSGLGLVAALTVPMAVAAAEEECPTFEDFGTIGSAHQEDVAELAALGIIRGRVGGEFDPRTPITRQEMASLVNRLREHVAQGGAPVDVCEVPDVEPSPEPEPTQEPEPEPEPEPTEDPAPEPEPTEEPSQEPTSEPEPTEEPEQPKIPAPTPVVPTDDECYKGWDGSNNPPASSLSAFPWHNTTGVCDPDDLAALDVHNGDLITSRNGQVIDSTEVRGDVLVKHSNVVIKRSWVHGEIRNQTNDPVRVIHVDAGGQDVSGARIRGAAEVYRSNVWGGSDNYQSSPGTRVVLVENFLHDLEGGAAHNDSFQINTDATATLTHNTFFAWEGGTAADRDSGPHWTGSSPLTVEGGGGATATSNIMLGQAAAGTTGTVEDNLFRGNAYCHVNIQAGSLDLDGNTYFPGDTERNRSLCGSANDPNAVIR